MSSKNLAVCDYASSYTGSNCDHQEIFKEPPLSKESLGHAQRIDVVIDEDWKIQCMPQS